MDDRTGQVWKHGGIYGSVVARIFIVVGPCKVINDSVTNTKLHPIHVLDTNLTTKEKNAIERDPIFWENDRLYTRIA